MPLVLAGAAAGAPHVVVALVVVAVPPFAGLGAGLLHGLLDVGAVVVPPGVVAVP